MAVCLTVMVGRASTIVGINILKDLLMRNCELSFNVFSCIILGKSQREILLWNPGGIW